MDEREGCKREGWFRFVEMIGKQRKEGNKGRKQRERGRDREGRSTWIVETPLIKTDPVIASAVKLVTDHATLAAYSGDMRNTLRRGRKRDG